jgi:hypothetical protein
MGTAETHLMTKLQAESVHDQDILHCIAHQQQDQQEGGAAEERLGGTKEKGRAWVGGGGGGVGVVEILGLRGPA